MQFRVLGPLEVVDQGRALPLGRGRQLALIALLLLNANRVYLLQVQPGELDSERFEALIHEARDQGPAAAATTLPVPPPRSA